MHDDQRDDDNALCKPSPEEIASACLEIQAGWSEQETIARQHFRLPKFRAVGVVELAEQAVALKLAAKREYLRRAVTGGAGD